jgi:LacI family transcriptional regulator
LAATIYDIADQAGVSIATVSRVLNNSANVSISTRDRVLAVSERLGYHPDALAQGLAKKRTRLITAIVPVLSNHFFMEVLAGMQDKLQDYDYDLNIYNVKVGDALEDQVEYMVKRGTAEGYVIISIHMSDAKADLMRRMEVPMVLIDDYHPRFDSVSVDSVEGAYEATQHLCAHGHTRIGMIAANPTSKPSIDRTRGYRLALADAGLAVDESLIQSGDDLNRDGFTEQNGYDAMLRLLALPTPPDACFCCSDIQALGAIKAMRDHGTHIPLIGFDDIKFSEYVGLSTMSQPMYHMGFMAIEKLIRRIDHPDADITHTVYSPKLVVRNSLLQSNATVLS